MTTALGPLIVDIPELSLSAEDKALLQHPLIGGVILFSRNFSDIKQLQQLVAEIKSLRQPELLIAVDQEGGRVQRFQEELTRLPSFGALGSLFSENAQQARSLTQTAGWLMAAELRAIGVDFSFTPVLDINYGLNQVIGDRSFNQDPQVILSLAEALIAGMQQVGMPAIGKHFPGHGGVSGDSHLTLPRDTRSQADMAKADLSIFKQLIQQQQLAGIMPAHIIYEQMDPLPPTFSRYWLHQVLREEIGFTGVIFSDDLSMEGASMVGDYPTRLRRALEAGCDIALICNKRQQVLQVLEECADMQRDMRASLSTFRSNGYPSFAQLQQESTWQQAHRQVQQFIETGMMTC